MSDLEELLSSRKFHLVMVVEIVLALAMKPLRDSSMLDQRVVVALTS